MRGTNNRLAKRAMNVHVYYARNRSTHGWDHVTRIAATAGIIASSEQNVDMETLYAMVYWLDIVGYEDNREEESIAPNKTEVLVKRF